MLDLRRLRSFDRCAEWKARLMNPLESLRFSDRQKSRDTILILRFPLKSPGNYRKDGNKGFDTIINRMQAQGYVLISDFRYMIDKNGKEYGWGVAEYSTPEQFLGKSFKDRVYMRTPEESFEALLDHFRKILPGMDENRIKRFLIK